MTRGVLTGYPRVYLQLSFVADGRLKRGGSVGFVSSLSLWNNLGLVKQRSLGPFFIKAP